MPISSRNFSKKQGHRLSENLLSDHDGFESPQIGGDARSAQTGIQVIKGGQKFIKYQKREEDVKSEELKRLIESAYTCFDSQFEREPEISGVNNGVGVDD